MHTSTKVVLLFVRYYELNITNTLPKIRNDMSLIKCYSERLRTRISFRICNEVHSSYTGHRPSGTSSLYRLQHSLPPLQHNYQVLREPSLKIQQKPVFVYFRPIPSQNLAPSPTIRSKTFLKNININFQQTFG